eukprot:scaffold71_cov247-Pinguiococcus_pyrenoidosus.AAC.30
MKNGAARTLETARVDRTIFLLVLLDELVQHGGSGSLLLVRCLQDVVHDLVDPHAIVGPAIEPLPDQWDAEVREEAPDDVAKACDAEQAAKPRDRLGALAKAVEGVPEANDGDDVHDPGARQAGNIELLSVGSFLRDDVHERRGDLADVLDVAGDVGMRKGRRHQAALQAPLGALRREDAGT